MARQRRPSRGVRSDRLVRPGGRVGFTIIEILIVLAMIVLLGALAAPSLMPMSDRAVWADAVEMIRSAGVLARSEAQRRGEPLELVALPGDSGGQRLVLRQFVRDASAGDTREPRRTITEIGEFAGGVRVAAASVDVGSDVEATPEAGQDPAKIESDDGQAPEFLLGVYWPGGGAESPEAWVLVAKDATEWSGKLNPWTGAISLSERTLPPDQGEPASEPGGTPTTEPAGEDGRGVE